MKMKKHKTWYFLTQLCIHLNFVHLAGDNSFEVDSLNCTGDGFFMCQRGGVDVCHNAIHMCDGIVHCDDVADEAKCGTLGNCPDSQFECRFRGRNTCLNKEKHQCDGIFHCDDASDESPSVCANCTKPGLTMCRDGSRCIHTDINVCKGIPTCADGSDESDEYSNCEVCLQNDTVPCPGFPGNCARVCDGYPTCPDRWDEMLSTCEAYNMTCSDYRCNDSSMCLHKELLCDAGNDCYSGEDEAAEHCKDKCQSLQSNLTSDKAPFPCDQGSCIMREQACSAQKQPLCKDGTDMSFEVCNGKCYTEYPAKVDPYRWPCADESKCILRTSVCNAKRDCPDGSDEGDDCPWYVRLNLVFTLLIGLAATLQSVLLHFLFSAWSRSLTEAVQSSPTEFPSLDTQIPSDSIWAARWLRGGKHTFRERLTRTRTRTAVPFLRPAAHSSSSTPSFLLHPALSDISGQNWSWQKVGEELRIEVIVFNRDNRYLLGLLSSIEAQDAHPGNVHEMFKGFFSHLESRGHTQEAVMFSVRQSIGHHNFANLMLTGTKGPPSSLVGKVYQLKLWLKELEGRGKIGFVCFFILNTLLSCISPFFIYLDNVKDFALLLILRGTVQRQHLVCPDLGSCHDASQAEKNLLDALLVTVSVSLVTTSLHAFHHRRHFFATNPVLDIVLFVSSPLLPGIYHMQLAAVSHALERERKDITNLEYQSRKQHIEKLTDIIQQSKSVEVGLESITQIFILCGLATFAPFVFKAPSGQTYSYFYGVAELVLKGNAPLFVATILMSFLGPCFFYVNNENHKKKESFNMGTKLVLLLKNVFFLLARQGAIISAIFIPIISQWDMFAQNVGVDAVNFLDLKVFEKEFGDHFSSGLQSLSDEIWIHSAWFICFFVLHLFVVVTNAVLCSPAFGASHMIERWQHLLSSFWLPLPFTSIREVNRGEEKPELWFLIAFHSFENTALLLASRWCYLPAYPPGLLVVQITLLAVNLVVAMLSSCKKELLKGAYLIRLYLVALVLFNVATILVPIQGVENGLLIIDICIITLNTLGVAASVLYTNRIELYADLPQILHNLPSFGPEVRLT